MLSYQGGEVWLGENSVTLSWKMESCRKRWGRASSAARLPVCSALSAGRKRRSEPQGKGCIWSLMSRSQAATFSSALFVFTGLSVSTPQLFCLVDPTVVLRLSALIYQVTALFFFSLPRVHGTKYNLAFLLAQSLASWQTSGSQLHR